MDSLWDQNVYGNQDSCAGANGGWPAILQGRRIISAQTEICLVFWLWDSMFRFSKRYPVGNDSFSIQFSFYSIQFFGQSGSGTYFLEYIHDKI